VSPARHNILAFSVTPRSSSERLSNVMPLSRYWKTKSFNTKSRRRLKRRVRLPFRRTEHESNRKGPSPFFAAPPADHV
jgi:hypothetical protein